LKLSAKEYKRIVIKIGSSLLFAEQAQGECFTYPLDEIVAQISALIQEEKEVVLVSSGAIALGMRLLKMKSRPKELVSLQATAAVGQHLLMNEYRKFFEKKGLTCAQILLTWEDFDDRKRYLNAKNTLLTLLELGSVPVINENDTISTDEIRFGDNDHLSALVATMINADLLIILSDVDGLLDKNKKVVKVVSQISAEVRELASPTNRQTSIGGMVAKIEAAKISVDSGIPCVIASGRNKKGIPDIVSNPASMGNWTLFVPKKGSLAARDRWIAFGTKPKGKIIVDDGAKTALKNNKSLLSVGVIGVEGDFECADIVTILDKQNSEFARGKTSLSSKQIDKIKGTRFNKEIVHRDNIVML
jgi:glutamate 5-kinase